ncbi:MAG: LacI family transcriptional regulator [Lentisphaerae bacterium]|nr:MAG: LacI family transcriptional regulator [Lentisphaerota bacterium]
MAKKSSRKTISIREVARHAGVSVATVSRVLNDGPVHERTRRRVELAIRETGYLPDSRAADLRRGQTRKIGLVMADLGNPAYTELTRTIHDELVQQGYSLLLGCTYGREKEEVEVLKMFQRERVDGVIVSTCEGEEDPAALEICEQLERHDVAIVFNGRDANGLNAEVVSADNIGGMQQLAAYLLRCGYQRMSFIAGEPRARASRERLEGLCLGIKAAGKQVNKILGDRVLCEGRYTIENGKFLALRMLQEKKPDVLVCGNDLMAAGALMAAENLGLRVPEDVAVCGFDDIYLAELVRPQLTTLRLPVEEVARLMCQLLMAKINGKAEKGTPDQRLYRVKTQLVIRGSA